VITTRKSFSQRLFAPDAGALVFLARLVLLPLAALYDLVVTARNALYDNGLIESSRVNAPVVSVGNLTVGGTGKTPMVIALANRAVAAGKKVAIVARGYGAAADQHGHTDEVALMAARCPGARVVMTHNKTAGAKEAVELGCDFLIVDDGLQHRALARDFELVMVDARAPFGNGSLLPGGPLRESPSGLGRASAIVLTHGETLIEEQRLTVLTQVRAFKLSVPVVWAEHAPIGVRAVTSGTLRPTTAISGRRVFLACGIASPEGFRQTVEGLGAEVAGVMAFQDHHDFTAEDLARVRAAARDALIVCTEKDALKIARIPGNDDIQCLAIELRLAGELPPIPGLDAPWSPPVVATDPHHHGAVHAGEDPHGMGAQHADRHYVHGGHGPAAHEHGHGHGHDHGHDHGHAGHGHH
jgi:tetraacyldisaccharide 4'-kinase